ncbi:MAG TPA: B12-binding domain-containing radical SAM protein, partial [Dehalococcoidia bacterium]|nr:B12-binding domain-containing radical SAM protein [Dehalococcoidia bacterium]
MLNIDRLLARVSKPARYTGGEWNSIVKDWDGTSVRIALAYPDVYDIGMSNTGLAILYDLLNREPDVVAERVYTPWPDMERVMRSEGIPLWSLETRHPLREFDAIGFSLSYEMTYSNILNMLDLSEISVLASERHEDDPIIIAGGSGALEPEPMADFVDAFALGEGEDIIMDVAECLRRWKTAGGGPRRELLRRLAGIEGMYVPSLYDISYYPAGAGETLGDNTVRGVVPNDSAAPARVKRRISQYLPPVITRPIVPYLQTVHDRAAIEIQRGCTQGCRFCQAGM